MTAGGEFPTRKPCIRCLLEQSGESELGEIVRQRIAAMPPAQKVPSEEYRRRLGVCRECDELISGTCRKCGCYAEIRAAKRGAGCPAGKWVPELNFAVESQGRSIDSNSSRK